MKKKNEKLECTYLTKGHREDGTVLSFFGVTAEEYQRGSASDITGAVAIKSVLQQSPNAGLAIFIIGRFGPSPIGWVQQVNSVRTDIGETGRILAGTHAESSECVSRRVHPEVTHVNILPGRWQVALRIHAGPAESDQVEHMDIVDDAVACEPSYDYHVLAQDDGSMLCPCNRHVPCAFQLPPTALF